MGGNFSREKEISLGGTKATKEQDTQQDAFRDTGRPYSVTIGRNYWCKGFDHCLMKMSKGGRAKFTISEPMGYGARGDPSLAIPPKSTIIFYVELIDIQ